MTAANSTTHWTPDQAAAIAGRGTELLVSAAAGSGKTAVLTERVLSFITTPTPPAAEPDSLEQLLVITFTRKAAREMRERIEQKIRKRLAERPNDLALRHALDSLPRANVMTLDAFCDRMVRRHFHQAEVSPDVRLAEESEEREISNSAASQVFEELSAVRDDSVDEAEREQADDFADLLAATPRGRESESATLLSRVHSVRSFMSSLDDPDSWVQATLARFEAILAAQTFEQLPHLDSIACAIGFEGRELAELFDAVIAEARALGGVEDATNNWSELCEQLQIHSDTVLSSTSSHIAVNLNQFQVWLANNQEILEKLMNKGRCGDVLKEKKSFRDHVLKKTSQAFKKFRERWFSLDSTELLRAEKMAAHQGRALLRLATRVETRVQEIKERRGVLGFNDVARKALRLLTDPASNGPSAIAAEYRDYFKHVLVDEYQDISPLQDAIIRRLARAGSDFPHGERNLFMVGDIKQSVYRFRRAEPALFARRLDEHGRNDPALDRVNLSTNFRSRPGVLAGVNAVCERLMDRAVGGIDYDDAARLNSQRDADERNRVCVESQWLLAASEKSDDGDPSETESDSNSSGDPDDREESLLQTLKATELEAEWIARRIRELTHPLTGMMIPDERTNAPRRARAGDCAILVRNLKSDANTWIATLARHGLRVAGAADDSANASLERSDLMSALQLADNPFNDYALTAALASPIFRMNESDLLRIRMTRRDGAFHAAFWIGAGRGAAFGMSDAEPDSPNLLSNDLAARIAEIAGQIEAWRMIAERADAESVLDEILRTTNYEAHVAGLSDADERFVLIHSLRAEIRSCASRGGASLAEFLRLRAADEIGRGSSADSEPHEPDPDAVRLMTIHKSKGLEFPIVFYARLGSQFNMTDSRAGLQLSSLHGLALEAIDVPRRLRIKPAGLLAFQNEEARQIRSEELRLIYVAMTRARERLILVGSNHTWKSEAAMRERWRVHLIALGSPAPALARMRAQSPAELIAPTLMKILRDDSPDWLSIEFSHLAREEPEPIALQHIRAWARQGDGEHAELRIAARREFAETFSADPRAQETLSQWNTSPHALTLPAPDLLLPSEFNIGLSRAPVKVFASTLRRDPRGAWTLGDSSAMQEIESAEWDVHAEDQWTPPAPLVRSGARELTAPAFIQSRARTRLDPAAIGTHTHALLRHLDLRGALDESGLRIQAVQLRSLGLLELDHDDLIAELPLADVAWFFTTELGLHMIKHAGSVSRELPFRRWVRASEIHELAPDGSSRPLASPDEDGRILVQGVVDCVIDEGSDVIVLDYKTDHARTQADVDALAAKYHAQIDAYRSALRAIWRTRIQDTALVFLRARKIVPVPDLTM